MQHQQSPRWKDAEVHPKPGAVSCVPIRADEKEFLTFLKENRIPYDPQDVLDERLTTHPLLIRQCQSKHHLNSNLIFET